MDVDVLDSLVELQLRRDGTASIAFGDGRAVALTLSRGSFDSSSMLASSTFLVRSSRLVLLTTRGDEIVIELPPPIGGSPVGGRPTIYLDQNHWSTLTNSSFEPSRVSNSDELSAASNLIDLAESGEVVLPMSSAHIAETCRQVDSEERYRRALTIARLSRGWQLRDPLAIRRFELRQAFTVRFQQRCLLPPEVVTLQPNALLAGRDDLLDDPDPDLPEDARWAVHAIRCIAGTVDTLLDAEHLPSAPPFGWADELQRFAEFLEANPSGRELRRRRTHAKFIADLGRELPEEAHRAKISPEEMSDWARHHSESDLKGMPMLGLFREVMHEKLCDPRLRWTPNDLTDMMYLTAGAGYCEHVVAERAHGSHISNGWRRQGIRRRVHTSLRSLVAELDL